MSEIKHQVELGEYAVDPGVLASEIIWKTQLIRKLRQDLEPKDREAGRTLRRRARRFRREAKVPIRMRPGQSW